MTIQQSTMTPTTRCIRKPGSRWTRCQCDPCRRRTAKTHKLQQLKRLDDGGRAFAERRLDGWMSQGWEPSAIASATGLSLYSAQDIWAARRRPNPPRLSFQTISLIRNAKAPTDGAVGLHGTRRRLQALAWMGWSLQSLADETGLSLMALSDARSKDGRYSVRVPTHLAVKDAFDHLQTTTGPSTKTARAARVAGWAPPAAWDDETLDDPDARPEGVDTSSTPRRQYIDQDLQDQIGELLRSGLNDREIGYRVGRSQEAVNQIRRRYDIRRAS